jgi:hypothetical protein
MLTQPLKKTRALKKTRVMKKDESDEGDGLTTRVQDTKPIAIKDYKATGRIAECLNCEETFNVTDNEKGNCKWHLGTLSRIDYFT